MTSRKAWAFMGGYVRIDLKELGVSSRNWTGLAQDRDSWRALVNATLNLMTLSAELFYR